MSMSFLSGAYQLIPDVLSYVLHTLAHNWLSLSLGIVVAAAIRVYLDPERMRDWLMNRASASIPATVVFGAVTPFCACGTMAVAVSMMAAALPWGAVMAFLTSSPLMSPEDFVLVSGILGRHFALALLVASLAIGLGAGYITHLIERRTSLLKGQFRFADAQAAGEAAAATDSCCTTPAPTPHCCGDAAEAPATCAGSCARTTPASRLGELVTTIWRIGALQILPLFSLFAGIGYLINRFVPTQAIMALFSAHNPFAVPIAALIGLPLYVTGAGALPLIKSLMAGGSTGGAMLAFMITGPGTSAGVIAGVSTIMKRRAVALYVAYILAGGILAGFAYNAIARLA